MSNVRSLPRWSFGARPLASLSLAAAAALLLAASILKAVSYFGSGRGSRALLALAVAEWLLGWWLLSGIARRRAVTLGIVCFLCFAAASLLWVVAGRASCSCFGDAHVSPVVMFLTDVVVAAALLLALTAESPPTSERRRRTCVAIAALGLLTGAGCLSVFAPKTSAAEDEELTRSAARLLQRIDVADHFKSGRWTVLLHRSGCPDCEAAKEHLLAGRRQGSGDQLALIELSRSYGDRPRPEGFLWGRLRDDAGVVHTPQIWHIEDGRVLKVTGAAQVDAEPGGQPSIPPVLAQPAGDGTYIADAGYVETAGRRDLIFDVRNDEQTAINILHYDVECSCTQLLEPPRIVPSRSSARVRVSFRAPPEAMVYAKQILLRTDSHLTPLVTLRLVARVGLPLSVSTTGYDFGALKEGAIAKALITFENAGSAPVKLLYATSDHSECFLGIPKVRIEPRERVVLPLNLATQYQSPGEYRAKIQLVTSDPQQHVFDLNVRYRVLE